MSKKKKCTKKRFVLILLSKNEINKRGKRKKRKNLGKNYTLP